MTDDDLKEKQDTQIDYWIIKMKKQMREKHLPNSLCAAVRTFYNHKFRFDPMMVQRLEEFKMLKPRLQKEVLDFLFKNYYKSFKVIFQRTDKGFKREIISNSEYVFAQLQIPETEAGIEN